MVSSAFAGITTPTSVSSYDWDVGTATTSATTYNGENDTVTGYTPTLLDQACENTTTLQDVSNLPRASAQSSGKVTTTSIEEDLITFDEPWTDTSAAVRGESPKYLIDLASSSPAKRPTILPSVQITEVNPVEPSSEDADWNGPPPSRTMTKDPYIVLGIAWGASNEECVDSNHSSSV